MREILFRGKRKDNGKWVEGYYGQFHNRPMHKGENSHQIFVLMEDATGFGSMIGGLWHEVIPETVGQYTGLTDKNGKKIFEGDIIIFNRGRNLPNKTPIPLVVYYDEENVQFTCYKSPYATLQKCMMSECEIIGNIHDNPELLKGGGSE